MNKRHIHTHTHHEQTLKNWIDLLHSCPSRSTTYTISTIAQRPFDTTTAEKHCLINDTWHKPRLTSCISNPLSLHWKTLRMRSEVVVCKTVWPCSIIILYMDHLRLRLQTNLCQTFLCVLRYQSYYLSYPTVSGSQSKQLLTIIFHSFNIIVNPTLVSFHN